MKNCYKAIAAFAAAAIIATLSTTAAFASYNDVAVETYSYTETADQVNLAEHTSYMTETYINVTHLKSADKLVATATVDDQGRVIITAVGSGNTTVSFWYKYSYFAAGDDWTLVTIPVSVSGTAATTSANLDGLIFPKVNISLLPDQQDTIDGITLNGNHIDASELLWFTPENNVITVDSATGVIQAFGYGTASLYAVTKDGQYAGCITVTVD